MLRKILKGLGVLAGLIVLGVVGLVVYVNHKVSKSYDLPLPNIQRDSSPEGLARGEAIYNTVCGECHSQGAPQAVGAPLLDYPKELGNFHSANITSDPVAGIGSMKDEEVARMIIHSINRDGKPRMMPAFSRMSDEDVAAVIGYLRSDRPEFKPHPQKAPPSEPSFVGRAVHALVAGINPKPREPLKAPPKGPTAEYGKYLATGIYDCIICHTMGFAGPGQKLKDPNLFAGGFEFDLAPYGGEGFMYSANITPHETQGLGKWTLEQFKTALTQGVTPDGHILRKPMPRYRYTDDVEMEALYVYLKSVPAVATPKMAHEPAPRPKADKAAADPEKLFSNLGCSYCHGPKGQFRDKLKQALGKQPEEVAKWIRNPESFKPGTQMPTFETLLDETQAVELAKWVQAKNGTP